MIRSDGILKRRMRSYTSLVSRGCLWAIYFVFLWVVWDITLYSDDMVPVSVWLVWIAGSFLFLGPFAVFLMQRVVNRPD